MSISQMNLISLLDFKRSKILTIHKILKNMWRTWLISDLCEIESSQSFISLSVLFPITMICLQFRTLRLKMSTSRHWLIWEVCIILLKLRLILNLLTVWNSVCQNKKRVQKVLKSHRIRVKRKSNLREINLKNQSNMDLWSQQVCWSQKQEKLLIRISSLNMCTMINRNYWDLSLKRSKPWESLENCQIQPIMLKSAKKHLLLIYLATKRRKESFHP